MPLVLDDNIGIIVDSLEALPDVIQARAVFAIKDSTIAKYGKDCVLLSVLYPTVEQRADKNNCDVFKQFQIVVSKKIYDNPTSHSSVVQTANKQVQTYYEDPTTPQIKVGVDLVDDKIVFSALE